MNHPRRRPRPDSPSRSHLLDRVSRACPIGPEFINKRVHFRVWAPKRTNVDVVITAGPGATSVTPLETEPDGYFSGFVPAAANGSRYRLRLDGNSDQMFSDPASRFQPDGPHGDSEVVDPEFEWTDANWQGVTIPGQVIYELHLGTFTEEGTWRAAMVQLPELKDAGITVIEIMPICDFPGRFGWGYDGVLLFAPVAIYGRPEDAREFLNEAHRLGIAVILDVVYNHFGPDGNYMRAFSDDYFSQKHSTEWGEAINFDDRNSGPVREFFCANAAYWIREFHFDGLRLDATHSVEDSSELHIFQQVTESARDAARERSVLVIAENEPEDSDLVRPVDRGGYGMDAMWNDDFHHSAIVALTGRHEAYYSDHIGTAQEFVSAIKHGFLYQGQWYSWQQKRRGSASLDVPAPALVHFLENHDQIANSALGHRVHEMSNPSAYRALTTLLLLGPQTPMLFQGQEFGASAPFHYFCDHKPELSDLVRKGRAEFLSQFLSLKERAAQLDLIPPQDPKTFEACKLDFSERERNAPAYNLHKDLLRLRKEDPVFCKQNNREIDGAVLAERAFVLRYFDETCGDRILVVNLGADLLLTSVPEPLLAPMSNMRWALLFSSDSPRYGGYGVYPPEQENGWRVPGKSATVLTSAPVRN